MNRTTMVAAMSFWLVAAVACVPAANAAVISLPDGTLTATPDGSGPGYGDTLATLDGIDAQNAPSVVIQGTITGMSSNSWVQVGLMRRSIWESAGNHWDQGIIATNWYTHPNDSGLSIKADSQGGAYAWPLSDLSTSDWDFTITMTPTGASGGTATFDVAGYTLFFDNPLAYTGDYSDAVLVIQFTSGTSGAVFSYADLSATTVPEPASALLLGVASLALLRRRRFARV